jgi:hypothetical protein
MIYSGFCNYGISFFKNWEGKRVMFDALFNGLGSINWEVIFQLLSIALIVISGPVVIFLLAVRKGNL